MDNGLAGQEGDRTCVNRLWRSLSSRSACSSGHVAGKLNDCPLNAHPIGFREMRRFHNLVHGLPGNGDRIELPKDRSSVTMLSPVNREVWCVVAPKNVASHKLLPGDAKSARN
jgi:hypothetical protein